MSAFTVPKLKMINLEKSAKSIIGISCLIRVSDLYESLMSYGKKTTFNYRR
jgi:hypothetical protein